MKGNDLLIEIIRERKKEIADNHIFRNNCLYYTKKEINIGELSTILNKKKEKVFDYFWEKGKFININQNIPWEWIKEYCSNEGIKLEKKKTIKTIWQEIINDYLMIIDDENHEDVRNPIVAIMGHVDHGKTTLLDTICQTNVQEKERGGITQKITVSQIIFEKKKIIFLDTPGHEDFIYIRSHSALLADIIILVISASDGLMKQTLEVIEYLKKTELPCIVFINKKMGIEIDNNTLIKIKSQLQKKGIFSSEWGNENGTIFVYGNAKNKEDTNRLCKKILLLSNHKTNFKRPADGIVINSFIDSKTNVNLTELLILGGILKERDEILLSGRINLVKTILDNENKKIIKASAGDFIRVTGIDFLPEIGDRFLVLKDKKNIEGIKKEINFSSKKKSISSSIIGKKNLILLADNQNSLETIKELIKKKEEFYTFFSVVYTKVAREFNNFLLNFTKVTDGIIVLFGFQLSSREIKIFRENNITFISDELIYKIEEKLREIVEKGKVKREIKKEIGTAIIEKVFYFSKIGKIAGCRVTNGKITRGNQIEILRRNEKIFTGMINSLEENKKKVEKVTDGHECGITFRNFNNLEVDDKIISFQIIKENV